MLLEFSKQLSLFPGVGSFLFVCFVFKAVFSIFWVVALESVKPGNFLEVIGINRQDSPHMLPSTLAPSSHRPSSCPAASISLFLWQPRVASPSGPRREMLGPHIRQNASPGHLCFSCPQQTLWRHLTSTGPCGVARQVGPLPASWGFPAPTLEFS